jgi:hypothetical protein
MHELRIKRSHPDFLAVDRLQHLYHVLINQHVHFDTNQQPLAEAEKAVIEQALLVELQNLQDGIRPSDSLSAFSDFMEER